jgi:site-specific DNA recombinase
VPEEWVFEDEGHSGATLVRPGLEALRDLAAQGCLDVVLVYSPDRLARKFAYQALLLEEFARAEVRVEFVTNGARDDSPEDQLLVTHARAPPQGRENPLKPPLTRPRTFRDDKFR